MLEPPADLEAEKRLVGTILIAPESLAATMGRVSYGDFFYKPFAAIYAAASDLFIENQPITAATIYRRLADQKVVSGQAEIAACMEGASLDEADFWINRVLTQRKRRRLLEAGEEAQKLALGDKDPDTAFARVQEMLVAGQDAQDSGTHDMGDAFDTLRARYNRYVDDPTALEGIPTGFEKFDRIIDGAAPGRVTTIFSETGSYKTTFIANVAWRLARQGYPGFWFTTESPAHEAMQKLVQLELAQSARDARQNREMYKFMAAMDQAEEDFRRYPLWINDRSVLDLGFLQGAVARWKKQHDIAYVIVDLLDHVKAPGFKGNETGEESHIMQSMKDMAKRNDVHVFLTTHMSKPYQQPAVKPLLYYSPDAMKGSSSKKQDSDNIISLMLIEPSPDGQWWTPLPPERRYDPADLVYVYAAFLKVRSGRTGHIIFEGDNVRGGMFYEYA